MMGLRMTRMWRMGGGEFRQLEVKPDIADDLHIRQPLTTSDLPINQLPDSHSDPAVQEGLGKIKELDAKLQV